MAREKSGGALLSTLDAEHAEWRPLLSLVEAALREMERPGMVGIGAGARALCGHRRAALVGRHHSDCLQFRDWLEAGAPSEDRTP